MRRTEYDPIPHASDVPHGHDTPIPPPASASADSEQPHALAVQARAAGSARGPGGKGRGGPPRSAGRDPHAGRADLGGEAP